MFEDYLTYLLAEKRYSPLTVRAYGDDIRQFALSACAQAIRRPVLPRIPAARARRKPLWPDPGSSVRYPKGSIRLG